MAGYTRFWKCEVCDTSQESIDYPKVEVCNFCIGADRVIVRQDSRLVEAIKGIATDAYLRGFAHGKKANRKRPEEIPA